MVDTRFHNPSGPFALRELLGERAAASELSATAAELEVSGAAELLTAGASDIALASSKDYIEELRQTRAGVVIVTPALRDAVPATSIAVVEESAHTLFVDLLERLFPTDTRVTLSGLESFEPSVEGGVVLGPHVVTGQGVEIGRSTAIGAGTVIGQGVTIGRNCIIGSNVTIECAHVGNNVVIHPGARIGGEGFGWLDWGKSNRKIPQLGRVIIQDGVEVGANSTIDRGALGDTLIGEGTKIDNLVQIGHNCRVGRFCLIAGQSGLAGSTILEDGVLFGGAAGAGGHLTVGRGAIVRARAGLMRDVPAGGDVAGVPARDTREFWREAAALRRLIKKEAR